MCSVRRTNGPHSCLASRQADYGVLVESQRRGVERRHIWFGHTASSSRAPRRAWHRAGDAPGRLQGLVMLLRQGASCRGCGRSAPLRKQARRRCTRASSKAARPRRPLRARSRRRSASYCMLTAWLRQLSADGCASRSTRAQAAALDCSSGCRQSSRRCTTLHAAGAAALWRSERRRLQTPAAWRRTASRSCCASLTALPRSRSAPRA